MFFLSFEFLDDDYDYVLCLKFDFPDSIFFPDLAVLTKALQELFYQEKNAFIILTKRKEAPKYHIREDETVYSFSCSFHHFKKMVKNNSLATFSARNLLFELIVFIAQHKVSIDKILVRQIPFTTELYQIKRNIDVIIPHRGQIKYLANLLQYLQKIPKLNLFAGIDQPVVDEDLSILMQYQGVNFFLFKAEPLGPYVVRNQLINQGNSEFIFFQDSDDIPCADRFARLSNYMVEEDVQLCGSHEIRMDYFGRSVRAVRYPLDVMGALDHGPAYALLHPSSAIRRFDFYRCGKLSEEKRFAIDTKFLYYCYFKLNSIRNIDEFLYIKKIRSGSLTTSQEFGLGSAPRRSLLNQWLVDFILVQQGLLKLEESTLNFVKSKIKFKMLRG